MPHRPGSRRHYLSPVEKQLGTEETWLAEALELIKKQRNALRAERLKLELRRQRLQTMTVEDIIAAREASGSQTRSEVPASGPPPLDEDSSMSTSSVSTSSMSEVDTLSQDSAQNLNDVSNVEDDIPDKDKNKDKDLNANIELAGPISNIPNNELVTSSELSEKVVPLDKSKSEQAIDKPN